MGTVTRRYTFKLQPSNAQAQALGRQLDLHRDLYNALLQQRQESWSRQRKGLTYFDQCKELTKLRAEMPEYAALSSGSMAATAQRLDNAYKKYFSDVKAWRKGKASKAPAPPRFKGRHFFTSIGFKAHRKSGWRMDHTGPKTWRLYVKDIPGLTRMRGKFPIEPTDLRSAELLHREGAWWLSVVTKQPARMESAGKTARVVLDPMNSFAVVTPRFGRCAASPATRFDWVNGRIAERIQEVMCEADASGLDSPGERRFETATSTSSDDASDLDSSGECGVGEAPDRLARIQQRMSRCRLGSNRYRKLKLMKQRLQGRQARRRDHALHVWSSAMASSFSQMEICHPPLRDATSRAHWAAVQTKSEVNKFVLSNCVGKAVQMLEYKCAEAGGGVSVEIMDKSATAIGNEIVEAAKAVKRVRRKLKKGDARPARKSESPANRKAYQEVRCA